MTSHLRPRSQRWLRSKAAKRWTTGANEVLLSRYNLNERQAVDRSLAALGRMEQYLRRRQVYLYGLDNPYMADHARRTLLSLALRLQGTRRKQPVRFEPILQHVTKEAA
jgi:hypothetical protein